MSLQQTFAKHRPRPVYIAARVAEMLVSLGSRALNAFCFGGSTHQTTSARSFIDGLTDPVWAARQRKIDALFFFHKDENGRRNHCEWSWGREVENARKTLERARVAEKGRRLG